MKNSSRDSVGILKWRGSSVSAFFILFFITLVLILGIVWSFSARITERVRGEGITLLSGGIRTVYAQGNGIMINLNVKTGSLINQDEIIGIIHNSEDYQKYVLKGAGPGISAFFMTDTGCAVLLPERSLKLFRTRGLMSDPGIPWPLWLPPPRRAFTFWRCSARRIPKESGRG